MAQTIHVSVSELPDTVRDVLKELGYGRRDIGIEISSTFTISSASGSGQRAFWCIVNIATGKHHIEWGSWGGANMFSQKNPVDMDTSPRQLPPGAVVIEGSQGGGQPTYATIIAHPENLKMLAAPKEESNLTPQEKSALNIIGGIKSSYRAEYFREARLGAYGPTNPVLQSLAQKGLVAITRVGIAITTAGRNERSNHRMASRVIDRWIQRD